tara:strand:- start:12646 stop:12897 length:252 start_codon:yes stop_codon:yes gene_type:complete
MDIKMKHTITQIVKGTTARLQYCQAGKLFYTVRVEDIKYTFPVDVTDINEVGDGIFLLEDKAITLMRYIRKAIASEEIRWEKP